MSFVVRDVAYAKEELDTTVKPIVRVINGVMDNDKSSPAGVIVQGRLDSATLRFIKYDDYQRKVDQRDDIWQALRDGVVLPNLELGVRGSDFDTEGKTGLLIRSPCYVVDGGQRIGNALRYLDLNPQAAVRLNATIHFNTTKEWETIRFDDLNKKRKKVSPNHHLRNLRLQNRAVLTLYGLCQSDKSSPLYDRVSWEQNMKRTDLLTAMTVAIVTCGLHSHLTGIMGSKTSDLVGVQLQKVVNAVGLPLLRRNAVTYFALLDQLWPFADITNRFGAPQIKSTFLFQLARLLSQHAIFWTNDNKELMIPADDRKKLGRFPINDPSVKQLVSASGAARKLLYQMMVEHMNSGRHKRRLVPRPADPDEEGIDE